MFWVRFPNESTYQEIKLDIDKFERRNEFDDEVFGLYEGSYISIKKWSIYIFIMVKLMLY